MKKLFLLLLPCFALLSCSKSQEDPDQRTVLVYIAGANDLSFYAVSNLEAMIQRYSQIGRTPGRNLVVYYDTGTETPSLLQIDQTGAHTLKQYPGVNSTSASQLSAVIADTFDAFPAESYGLILWSHATGWAPKGFPLTTKNQTLSAAFPATRTFGNQYFNGEKYEMDLSELSAALPSGSFDFIIADACLMGGVEVAYALRDKTDYFVAYPTEVIAEGLPYQEITSDLVSSAPAETVCRNICVKFFDYYNARSGYYRSAAVTLVKTSGLAELATAVRETVKDNPAVDALSLSGIQHYDLFDRPFMYDLQDFIAQIATASQYAAFETALSKTVLYHAHTPAFFSLPLENCCGLSSYIPCRTYAEYNAYYHDTQWYRACYR